MPEHCDQSWRRARSQSQASGKHIFTGNQGDWEMEISVRDECTADLTRESNPVCQVVGKAQNTEARAL